VVPPLTSDEICAAIAEEITEFPPKTTPNPGAAQPGTEDTLEHQLSAGWKVLVKKLVTLSGNRFARVGINITGTAS
jgi:hypothetical protein